MDTPQPDAFGSCCAPLAGTSNPLRQVAALEAMLVGPQVTGIRRYGNKSSSWVGIMTLRASRLHHDHFMCNWMLHLLCPAEIAEGVPHLQVHLLADAGSDYDDLVGGGSKESIDTRKATRIPALSMRHMPCTCRVRCWRQAATIDITSSKHIELLICQC